MNRSPYAIAVLVMLSMLALGDAAERPLQKLFEDDFSNGSDLWEPTDPSAWRIAKKGKGAVYSQHKKRSDYEPPHRSPYNISLLREIQVTDLELTVDVLSTHEDYGHRDVCLFFGYQDPAHFYYVHLGKQTDDHANQVFIVNGAPRVKISTKTTEGTNWDEKWHTVRIKRDSTSGAIAVFFDNMKTPVMTATDTTFRWGRVGVGSFDDTGDWDNIRLKGKLHNTSSGN